jgi:hypothetical protein
MRKLKIKRFLHEEDLPIFFLALDSLPAKEDSVLPKPRKELSS